MLIQYGNLIQKKVITLHLQLYGSKKKCTHAQSCALELYSASLSLHSLVISVLLFLNADDIVFICKEMIVW